MRIEGHSVFVRLTGEGIAALRDYVPSGLGFSALVVGEQGYGVWLVPEKSEAVPEGVQTLVRWNYVAAMTLMPEMTAVPKGTGRRN
jgi:hypothetical protein